MSFCLISDYANCNVDQFHFSTVLPAVCKIEELGKELQLEGSFWEKLRELSPKIIELQDDPQIEWFQKYDLNGAVLRLKEIPHLILKTVGRQSLHDKALLRSIANRQDNAIKARKICQEHHIDLLAVPLSKKIDLEIEGQSFPIFVQEWVDVKAQDGIQEELYRVHSEKLDELARQLAIFGIKSGFRDMNWRNIPLLEPDHQRVSLMDLEHAFGGEISSSLLGGALGSRGLIRCLFSEKQIDAALAIGIQEKVIMPGQAREIKRNRMEEIATDRQLLDFYEREGILENPKKSIEVDLTTLGLDLRAEDDLKMDAHDRVSVYNMREKIDATIAQIQDLALTILATLGLDLGREDVYNMREVAEATIAQINDLISKKPDDLSPKTTRYIVINTNKEPFLQYSQLGWDRNALFGRPYQCQLEKSCWMDQILKALVAKGHIFRLVKANGHGYFIQA